MNEDIIEVLVYWFKYDDFSYIEPSKTFYYSRINDTAVIINDEILMTNEFTIYICLPYYYSKTRDILHRDLWDYYTETGSIIVDDYI